MAPFAAKIRRPNAGTSADAARRVIGTALLLLLIAMVLFGFVVLLRIEADSGGLDRALLANAHSPADLERLARIAADQSKANAERLALFLNIVFGPVVTLLGSVTGFYFGTRARKE